MEGTIRRSHEAVLDLSEARLIRAARAGEPGACARLWSTVADELWSIAAAVLPERAAAAAIHRVRERFDAMIRGALLGRPWREGVYAALWEALAPALGNPTPARPWWRLRTPEPVHRRVRDAVAHAAPLSRLIWCFALLGDVPAAQLARWSGLGEDEVRSRRGEMAWRIACAMRGGSAEHEPGLTPLVCALFHDLPPDSLQLWSDRIDSDPELRALSNALSTAADACRAALSQVAPEPLTREGAAKEAPSSRLWLLFVPVAAALAIGLGVHLAQSPPQPPVVTHLQDAHIDRVFANAPREIQGWIKASDGHSLRSRLLAQGVYDPIAEPPALPAGASFQGAAPLPGGGAVWVIRTARGEELTLHAVTSPFDGVEGQPVGDGTDPAMVLATRDEIKAVFWSRDGVGYALALRGDPNYAVNFAREMTRSEGP